MRRHLPGRTMAFSAAVVALAASCAGIDRDEARICRTVLPALEPAGTRVSLIAIRSTSTGVAVEFTAMPPNGEAARKSIASCRFARVTRQADLVGLTIDDREVSGASLYLLKHIYVDTPEGIAGDPGAGGPDLTLPELSPRVASVAQQLLAAAPGIAVLGLLATSYALVFGLVGRINLAFGELAAIGAASLGLVVAGWSARADAAPAALAIGTLAALASAALYGAVVGHAAFIRIRPAHAQASLIATVGASLALSEFLRLRGAGAADWLPPLGRDPIPLARAGDFVVALSPGALGTAVIGFLACAALVLAMRRTAFGRAWRACADDAVAVALCGISPQRILLGTLILSGAGAGLAGALIALQFGAFGFADGLQLGLKALAAAILGGVGSVPGAFAGGIAIGLFEALWSTLAPIAGRDLALDVALVAAVVLRPNGLFGGPATPPGA